MKHSKETWITLIGAVMTFAAPACSSAPGGDDAGATGTQDDGGGAAATDGGVHADSGSSTAKDGGASKTDAGHAGSDAGTDAGTDGGHVDGGGSTGVLTLTSAALQNIDRHGTTLRLTVQGGDTAGLTTAAHVRFVDANGAPVSAFDSNWDGLPDLAERRVRFDTSTLGKPTFTQTITLRGAFGIAPAIAKAIVSLESETGARSAEITTSLVSQLVRDVNDPCDKTLVANRCTDGISCGGTNPTVCVAGVAPAFTAVGYYGGGATAPTILFEGNEPDQDLSQILVEFLDASNHAISVDLAGDGSNVASQIILSDLEGTHAAAAFAYSITAAPGFETKVAHIASTPSDSAGHTGARVITALGTPPTRSLGQSCDLHGIDQCAASTLCSPGLAGSTNVCGSASTLRSTSCTTAAASKLDPSTSKRTAYGVLQGTSLWDPPAGCAPPDSVQRPEATVALHLGAAAASLTISTALPETDADTVVYLLGGCAVSGAAALGCNDDVTGFSSTLVLSDVPAGDYTIVVDSVSPRGGNFGLTVSTP